MTVNNILKHQDKAHYERLAQNWEDRRLQEEISMQNVDRWRQEVYASRIENIRTLKTSKKLSQRLVEDQKRKTVSDVSVSSGSSFAGSSGYFWTDYDEREAGRRFATSINTSSLVGLVTFRLLPLFYYHIVVLQVHVPKDIEDRIKNAKRYMALYCRT